MSGPLAVTPYRPLSEVVYSKLREAIYEGTLGPGQRLVQADLARKLGVSRIPVREALHRLSEEGLVVCRPHKGATVRRPIASELQESSAATRILVRAAIQARDKVKLLAAADRHTTNNAQTLLGLITAGTAADDCAAL